MSLDAGTRARLYEGISRLIEDAYGGRVVKGYQTTLDVAPGR